MDQGSSWLPETTPFCFVFVFPFSRLGEISELFRSVGRRHCRSDEARLVRLGSSKPKREKGKTKTKQNGVVSGSHDDP